MQLGNLLEQGRITFAPNSTEVAGLVNYLLTENEVDDYNYYIYFILSQMTNSVL